MKKQDAAIVIGHDWTRKGAFSPHLNKSEYDYNKLVALNTGCDVFSHTPNVSYRRKMRSTYRNLSEYAITLELHFNAALSHVQGAEALYFHTNTHGAESAKLFSDMVSKEYSIKDRGAKPLSNSNQRGYWAVASGVPTGLILEPFFGSHKAAVDFNDVCRYSNLLIDFIENLNYR